MPNHVQLVWHLNTAFNGYKLGLAWAFDSEVISLINPGGHYLYIDLN
jgi:hypothetical protein